MNGFGNQMMPQSLPTQGNSINWVQGIEGAKSWSLYPNSNVVLLDQDTERFYIKTCDNIGMCSIRTFEYKEIQLPNSNQSNIDMSKFVTKDELQKILEDLLNGKQSIQSDNGK